MKRQDILHGFLQQLLGRNPDAAITTLIGHANKLTDAVMKSQTSPAEDQIPF